jgi:hypothetical protein
MTRIRTHYFLVASTIVFFSTLTIAKIIQTPYLYSLDPWRDVFFTPYAEPNEFFTAEVEVHNGKLVAPYRTFLRSSVYLFSSMSGLDAYSVFRFASVFLRILYVLLAYAVVNTFIEDRKLSLIVVFLIYSSDYFVWRSYITFPENLAVLFHLLSLWSLENHRRTGKSVFLVTVAISLSAVLFVHPKSLFFSGFIVTAYVVPFLIAGKFKAARDILTSIGAVVILALPVLVEILKILASTVTDNFGDTSSYGAIARALPTYLPPTYASYEGFIGPLILLFTFLGIVRLVGRGLMHHLHILLLLAFSILLSLGTYFKLYVPTDRMQAYLFIPLILVASISLESLFRETESLLARRAIVTAVVVLSVFNVVHTDPWFGLRHGEIEIADRINQLLVGDSQSHLVSIEANIGLIAPLLADPDRVCIEPGDLDFVLGDNPQSLADCDHAQYRVTENREPPEGYSLLVGAKDYYLFQRDGQ